MYTFLIVTLIYLAGIVFTFRICLPPNVKNTPMDFFVVPIISVLWPLAWGFIILSEIAGWARRKIKTIRRKRKFDIRK